MKNLDKKSKEYQILDSDNKIIDILLDPSTQNLFLIKKLLISLILIIQKN